VSINQSALLAQLQDWGSELGFSEIGIAPVDLRDAEPGLLAWLAQGHHGEMAYMARHGLTRARPAELVPGTLSVITARMDYLPPSTHRVHPIRLDQRNAALATTHSSRGVGLCPWAGLPQGDAPTFAAVG
jgi:epoxyqueuosine reductase QueG